VHFEVVSFFGSSEVPETLLIPLKFGAVLSVIGAGEVAAAFGHVATVCDKQIASAAKGRPRAGIAVDEILLTLGNEFLAHVEGQQKGLFACIVQPAIFDSVPLVVRETCDGLAELSPDEREGVRDVVALVVEDCSVEVVLRRSEDPFQLHTFVEAAPQKLEVLFVVFGCLG
jgi:hypothetical protein